jgi:hypothetical protein
MPVKKINENNVNPISCGNFSLGGHPIDMNPCITGVPELFYNESALPNGDLGDYDPSDGNFLVGNGLAWVVEAGADARASLGLGDLAVLDVITVDEIDASGVPSASTFLRGDGTWAAGGGGGGGGDLLAANNLSDVADAAQARANLSLTVGTHVQAYDADLTTIAGLAKNDGAFIVGDGANWTIESGATARASLGLVIGTNVQAYSANLTSIAGLAVTDGNIIVGNGSGWVVESGSTARNSLGLGSLAVENNINNGNWSGADLDITNGGTGASTAADARTNLGVAIGSNVQAYSSILAGISSVTPTDSVFLVGNGSAFVGESGSTARTSLGLGSIATLNSVNDANWSGTDLAVANGGTGASSASAARTNLGLAIGVNVQAYSVALDGTTESFTTELLAKIDSIQAEDGSVFNATTGQLYVPGDDTDFHRGNAFLAAEAAAVPNSVLRLGAGKRYIFSSSANITTPGLKLIANKAIFSRPDGVQTDWVIQASGTDGYDMEIYDLEVDGNYDNVTLVSGSGSRGEGIRVSGGGPVTLHNVYAHSSPIAVALPATSSIDDAAVNFFVIGSGHKKLVNCRGDRPSYANYRIQATTSEFIGCDSFVSEFTGNYGRFFVMDGDNVRHCIINGGTWKTDQAMKINANFDPSTNNTLWCERLILSNIIMDFGTGHTMPDGDSFIKFDNCRYVMVSNVTQTHSEPFVPHPTDPLTEPGTGFKWWFPTVGIKESLFSVGTCTEVHFENVIADGHVKLTGSSGGPYSEIVSMRNCIWGNNAHILFGVENCNHAKLLLLENCSFKNVIGSGSTIKVFDNTAALKNQKIRIKNCFVSTFWTGAGSTFGGYLFGRCDKVGDIAVDDLDLIDLNTDDHVNYVKTYLHWVESSSDPEVAYNPTGSGYPTYPLNTPTLRLMVTPRTADPSTAYLHRNIFRTYDYTNFKFVNGTPTTLATSATYAHSHQTPIDPGTDAGNWFPSIIGDPGTRIMNLQCGAGGNGYPVFWIANLSGDFIEDPSITLY